VSTPQSLSRDFLLHIPIAEVQGFSCSRVVFNLADSEPTIEPGKRAAGPSYLPVITNPGCYTFFGQSKGKPMKRCYRIINIVGARPNLPKIAPLIRDMQRHPQIEPLLVHTGQHYDENLSNIFFRQMGIPEPHINLGVGSGSHA